MALLFDTNIFLRFASGEALRGDAGNRILARRATGERAFVSSYTAWEIGMLVSKGRYQLTAEPLAFFDEFVLSASFVVLNTTTSILVASHFLPGKLNKDPADRIIVATARARGLTLCTTDADLVSYGRAGHLAVLPC